MSNQDEIGKVPREGSEKRTRIYVRPNGIEASQQQPRIYVRRNGMMYRITVGDRNVWIERQTPRGSNYPCRIPPEDLFSPGWDVWNLDKLDEAIAEYEGSDED